MARVAGAPNEIKRMAATIALSHHERWDGSGYPQGLAAEAIPLEARIGALADVYDALRSDRPYKAALGHAETMDRILAESGSHFDPAVVAAFDASIDRIQEVFASLSTDDPTSAHTPAA